MALSRYRMALRTPGVARILGTSLVARACQGMSGLSILLLISRHHGYGRAGLVSGAYVLTAGLTGLVLARIVDRVGPRPVLLPCAFGYAGAMAGLSAVPDSAYDGMFALAVLAGLFQPSINSVVRGIWPRLLDEETIGSIYALEATAQELVFIAGPALVAVIAGLAGPRGAVAATGVLTLVGTVALASAPQLAGRVREGARVRHRILRRTRLPVYIGLAFALCIGFNMADVGVVAFVGGRHNSAAAGVILAIWSLGSMTGGLWWGTARGRVDDAVVARFVLAIAASLAVCATAPGRVGLALLLGIGGMTVAPGLGRLYTLVGGSMPSGASTEAFAWIGVGLLFGSSIGAALGGLSVDTLGPRPTFLLAATAPAVAAAAVLAATRRSAASVVLSTEEARTPEPVAS